jgi:carbon monoxide dehydrogenase subunit G
MKISGADTIDFPIATVWDALLDPQVLVSTIPGCERLEATGENAYAMTVTAGVASIRGTYTGSCTLSDLEPHESLVMTLQGAGAPGTIGATVDVRFEEVEQGVTKISYEADAVVGGMVGGVGQRMLTSVSKRMANEFFTNVASSIADPRTPAEGDETAAATGVFTAPPRAGAITSHDDFIKGIAVGAGLVLLGVAAGTLASRGRRR